MCNFNNDNCICTNCPTGCEIFKLEDLKLVGLICKYMGESRCYIADDEFCEDCGACYESEEEAIDYDNWLLKK